MIRIIKRKLNLLEYKCNVIKKYFICKHIKYKEVMMLHIEYEREFLTLYKYRLISNFVNVF